jgi:putative aldouronate transport system permease protein
MPILGLEPKPWYMTAKAWPFILVFVNAWKNVGYLCIIFLGAILGIDKEYFEAASIEGATKIQQIRYITMPMISSVVVMMTLIFIGRIFYSDFGLFYHVPMNSGMLYSTTNVIETYVYRGLMQLGDIGMSSAAGLYQSVVGFFLVLLANFAVRKISPENAMF